MSATYQQDNTVRPEVDAQDPNNILLARGPRFRLEAEMVRDQALALSGLLVEKIGGPSVYPPQPPGLWRAAFNGADRKWPTSKGEDKYRRGVYHLLATQRPLPEHGDLRRTQPRSLRSTPHPHQHPTASLRHPQTIPSTSKSPRPWPGVS